MKNIFKHASTPIDNLEFDNSVTYRNTFSRAAKRPKLSSLFVSSIRRNWEGMERMAMVATVVASFALGFPVSTVHAEAAQIGIQIGGPEMEPVCTYGYYEEPPYACAPVGYWGPEYFYGGHFRGVGLWAGQGRDYNRGNGEKNFRQSNRGAGRSENMGSRGGGERGERGGHGHERP